MQTGPSVLFGIAWGSFALFFIGAFAGTVLLECAYRLALAVLPLILTAFAVTHARDPRLQLGAQAIAIGIYVLLAWIVAEQVHFWGIQFELPLSLIAYAAALMFPPGRALREPSPLP